MKFGKSVWHASRISDSNAEVSQYDNPIEIITRPNYLTVMQASTRGFLEIMKYGETAQNHWTIIANRRYFERKSEFFIGKNKCGDGTVFAENIHYGDFLFKEGDLMWVDGESPIESVEKMYGNGATANAIVKNVVEVNHTISITLERNQNQILK